MVMNKSLQVDIPIASFEQLTVNLPDRPGSKYSKHEY